MNIGIMTFHYAHNYGAMLQAFALSEKINRMGYDVQIIDYRLPEIYDYHAKLSFPSLVRKYQKRNSRFISLIKALKNYPQIRFRNSRWEKFETFLEHTIKKTPRISEEQIQSLNIDILIYGSDQIWNAKITSGLKPVYFAANAPINAKKIAYAASCGTNYVEDKDEASFTKLVQNFDFLSVRENGLANYLCKKINKDVPVVLDPVFLLEKKDWNILASQPLVSGDYVLVYSFNEDNCFYKVLNNFLSKTTLKIVAIVYSKNKHFDRRIQQLTNVGPKEFVNLFLNARNVLTNSFHGTAFSILFNKPFFTIKPQLNAPRIESLLSTLNLSHQMIYQPSQINFEQTPNFEEVNEELTHLRENAEKFLLNAINSKSN